MQLDKVTMSEELKTVIGYPNTIMWQCPECHVWNDADASDVIVMCGCNIRYRISQIVDDWPIDGYSEGRGKR